MVSRGQPVRVAIVGCGEVTRFKHLPSLQALPGVQVVALVDTDKERLDATADRFGIASRYEDLNPLLDDPSVEAVGVCVPTAAHVEVALPLLEAGKHILIEKPLALSLKEVDFLMEAEKKSTSIVMVGFHMRWHRLVRQVRSILQSDRLGHLESIRSIWNSPRSDANIPSWKTKRHSGGGALVEIGVHHFDLWRFLLETEVEEIFAYSRHGSRDDECAVISARLMNGMLASAVFSERTSHDIELELYGVLGRLRVCCQRFDGLSLYSTGETSGTIESRLRGLARTVLELPGGFLKMRRGGDYRASYRAEWLHFIECIETESVPECTLKDGRRVVEICLAATESASVGKPVSVSDSPDRMRNRHLAANGS